jgi:hypothetical protein
MQPPFLAAFISAWIGGECVRSGIPLRYFIYGRLSFLDPKLK